MSQVWAYVLSVSPQPSAELSVQTPVAYCLECESPYLAELADRLPHRIKAWLYPELCSPAAVGDVVLLNVGALELGLGTGGAAFVIARIPAQSLALYPQLAELLCSLGVAAANFSPPDPEARIVKMRYSPHQLLVQSIESQESPFHERLAKRSMLKRPLPVICCELHSQAIAAALALRELSPDILLGYLMTDEGALAASYSQNLSLLRRASIFDFSISIGQAFGGDYEAISLASACLAAEELGATALIVSMGPGVLGTATCLGTSALAQAEALNMLTCIGAHSFACLRLSEADKRLRHRGLSHHSLAVFRQFTLVETEIALASREYLQAKEAQGLRFLMQDLSSLREHRFKVDISHRLSYMSEDDMQGFYEFSAQLPNGMPLTSMGRSKAEDELFFSTPYACALALSRFLEKKVSESAQVL